YPAVVRDDTVVRAFSSDVLRHGDGALIDVRSPAEYSGEITSVSGYPLEATMKGGHVPGAVNVPWASAALPDGRFRDREELDALYAGERGLGADDDIIVYCRIGERSAHSWFVL